MNSPFKLVIHVLHGVIALEFYLPKIKPFWFWNPHLLKTVQYILYQIEISKPFGALIFLMSYVRLQSDKRCLYCPFNDDYYLVYTIRQIYVCIPFLCKRNWSQVPYLTQLWTYSGCSCLYCVFWFTPACFNKNHLLIIKNNK